MASKTEERKTAATVAEAPEEPKAAVDTKTPEGVIEEMEAKGIKPKKISLDAKSPSGIWSYIGPNIKGVIHTGKTFRGTRAQVLTQAGRALEAEPRVQRLIVAGEELARARVMVATPGNATYETFKAIAEEQKTKEANNV